MGISPGIEDIGSVRWQNALCHFICWLTVYLVTVKGTKIAGRVVYVTATAPYFLLTALFIYTMTMEGSVDGVKYFLIPKWEKLLDHNVWLEAAIQNIYQGAAAWGGLITLSSFNRFDRKVYRDAWLLPATSLFTSFFSGITIFSTLGVTALKLGVSIEELSQSSGPGLAFIVYPEAIAQMPLSPLWACVFFLTLITVGIDTLFALFETMISGLIDSFAILRRYSYATKTICAIFSFLIGLPFCTNVNSFNSFSKPNFNLILTKFREECTFIPLLNGIRLR